MKKFILLFIPIIVFSLTLVSHAQVLDEPNFLFLCPDGYDTIDQIGPDGLLAINEPTSHTYQFDTGCDGDANFVVFGYSKEGHPEFDCTFSGGDRSVCNQIQDMEEYDVDVDGGHNRGL